MSATNKGASQVARNSEKFESIPPYGFGENNLHNSILNPKNACRAWFTQHWSIPVNLKLPAGGGVHEITCS